MLTSSQFLDGSECAETVRRVNRLRDRWTRRSDSGFFTLGTASYLDAAESHDAYLGAAAQSNSVLSNAFGDVYAGLKGFLESIVGEPIAYGERLALPGFHVFEFYAAKSSDAVQRRKPDRRALAEKDAAKRAHFDLQFLRAFPNWTPEATLSFTLPLAQPPAGAGLAVWPLRYDEAVRRNQSAPSFAEQNRSEWVKYETGKMILHDGLLLHAILHSLEDDGQPLTGQRITLQGHGVRRDGRWIIYW